MLSGDRQQLSWMPVNVLAVIALAGLIAPLAAMPYRVSAGYNEGWNALWSNVALSGGALYPAPDAAIANNYPPLSFYLVGALGRVLGDNIIAGRIVSLASLLGIAWLLFTWLRLAGLSRQLATFGAVVFLAAMTSYAPGYIAFDDPQLLAHAVMLVGLVLLWRGHSSVRAVVISAMIMVSAGFIKHLLLPLPLAMTIWLAFRRRECLGVWVTAVAVTAGALSIACWMAFGVNFFRDLLASREYDLPVALRETASACLHLSPMLILTGVAAAAAGRLESPAERDAARLIGWYAALSAAIGIAASTGVGVNVNAFFDLLIACNLGSALGLGVLARRAESSHDTAVSGRAASTAAWITAVILGILVAGRLPAQFSAMGQLSQRAHETERDVRILRDLGRGHAACEEPALCYWAGSRFEWDAFNFSQKLETGTLSSSACDKVFGAGSIAVLQLTTPVAAGTSRLPQACNQIIRRYFTPIRESSNGEILIRRR
jgi:hypothetical protein